MKVSGMRERETDMGFLQRETEITSKGIGSMICVKDRAVTIITIKTSFSLENGSMINQR
jgi:hypothetical protein